MKTDIEIARSVEMRRITEIAENIGIKRDDIAQYGHYMAKVPGTLIDPEKVAKRKAQEEAAKAEAAKKKSFWSRLFGK